MRVSAPSPPCGSGRVYGSELVDRDEAVKVSGFPSSLLCFMVGLGLRLTGLYIVSASG